MSSGSQENPVRKTALIKEWPALRKNEVTAPEPVSVTPPKSLTTTGGADDSGNDTQPGPGHDDAEDGAIKARAGGQAHINGDGGLGSAEPNHGGVVDQTTDDDREHTRDYVEPVFRARE